VSEDEQTVLIHLSRSAREAAAVVARAKALLAVVDGASYRAAAQVAGRRSGDAVARLVARFNGQGLEALVPRHDGGRQAVYTSAERERILREARRQPEHEHDGTATWSLVTLQRALRRAPEGLPQAYTIWCVLRDAGWSWQRTRTWCPTDTAVRKRKRGIVTVRDPDTEAKRG
jgi:transposase